MKVKQILALTIGILGASLVVSPTTVKADELDNNIKRFEINLKKLDSSIENTKKSIKKAKKELEEAKNKFLKVDMDRSNLILEKSNTINMLKSQEDKFSSIVFRTALSNLEQEIETRKEKLKEVSSERAMEKTLEETFGKVDRTEKIDKVIEIEEQLKLTEPLYVATINELNSRDTEVKSLERTLEKISAEKKKDKAELDKKKEEKRVREEAARRAREEAARRASRISSRNIATNLPGSTAGIKVSNFARSKVGGPYIWGGNGPTGYDCSGLTAAAYRSLGISLPRTASAQAGVGRTVSYNAMKPGDLIFFGSPADTYHVAIYVGNGQIVHASTPKTGIVITTVNNSWMINNQYLVKRIVN